MAMTDNIIHSRSGDYLKKILERRCPSFTLNAGGVIVPFFVGYLVMNTLEYLMMTIWLSDLHGIKMNKRKH